MMMAHMSDEDELTEQDMDRLATSDCDCDDFDDDLQTPGTPSNRHPEASDAMAPSKTLDCLISIDESTELTAEDWERIVKLAESRHSEFFVVYGRRHLE